MLTYWDAFMEEFGKASKNVALVHILHAFWVYSTWSNKEGGYDARAAEVSKILDDGRTEVPN